MRLPLYGTSTNINQFLVLSLKQVIQNHKCDTLVILLFYLTGCRCIRVESEWFSLQIVQIIISYHQNNFKMHQVLDFVDFLSVLSCNPKNRKQLCCISHCHRQQHGCINQIKAFCNQNYLENQETQQLTTSKRTENCLILYE